ncbi:RNA polymerase sigma factor [Natrinema halophilum]|uniref:RNA polymerase sigma factor n=1 Tax=Natrinema halophilum TaxID=1699371 RepID=UPI001F28033F|nr:sigma factor-like helix-turn-helix DNA-binding protein [Natrinema halophilum]UHQ96335.1 LuxR C-terminal-related transcriptional regulator [Natrinema halophilum]
MPHQPTVSEETEFDGLPRRLPDQKAVLIGRVVGDGEFSGLAAYYIHGRGSILLGQYTSREFMPEYAIECKCRLMSACVREFSTANAETELSSVGKALLQAWHFGDLTTLSHKQAHVYALREKAGFGRDETAAILNISPSTVDTHLQRATEKLTAAENLVQFVRVDSEELADANPDFLEEAGVGDDENSSNNITHLS